MALYLLCFFLFQFHLSRPNVHAQGVPPSLAIDGPASEPNPLFRFEILVPYGNYSGLFNQELILTETEKVEELQLVSRGDAYLFNALKFISNLVTHIDRESGRVTGDIPVLPLHPRPLDRLGSQCEVPAGQIDVSQGFILGIYSEDMLVPGSPLMNRFTNPCTPPGFVPLLACLGTQGPGGGIQNGQCICSPQLETSRWTSFTYQPIIGLAGTPEAGRIVTCIGNVGSICRTPDLSCTGTLPCDSGTTYPAASFCGGELGTLARGFGAGIRSTDEELVKFTTSRNFRNISELENYVIRVANAIGVLDRDCNPSYWNWATTPVLPIMKLVNSTNPNYRLDIELHKNTTSLPVLSILYQYHLASILRLARLLDASPPEVFYDINKIALTRRRAVLYETGDRCLNEFPSTACLQKPTDPQRGLCQCATKDVTGSHIFDYFEEDGVCVGREGVVCTTVRGSGDHNCARGFVCQPPLHSVDRLVNARIPGPLVHHAIKICTLPIRRIRNQTWTEGLPNFGYFPTFDLFPAVSLWLAQPAVQRFQLVLN